MIRNWHIVKLSSFSYGCQALFAHNQNTPVPDFVSSSRNIPDSRFRFCASLALYAHMFIPVKRNEYSPHHQSTQRPHAPSVSVNSPLLAIHKNEKRACHAQTNSGQGIFIKCCCGLHHLYSSPAPAKPSPRGARVLRSVMSTSNNLSHGNVKLNEVYFVSSYLKAKLRHSSVACLTIRRQFPPS